jgi:hypothetical protein
MRRLTICIVLTLSLVPAGVAAAKEPVKAKVCGPDSCRTVQDQDSLMALTEGGPPTQPPKRGAGWYSVRMTIQTGPEQFESFPLVIVPSAGLVRGGDATEGYSWGAVSDHAANEYRRITRGLVAYPAGALKGVGPPKVRVDEVVLPPDQPKPDGGSSPLPWIAGGVLLLGAAGLLIRRRGLPWPRPAEG